MGQVQGVGFRPAVYRLAAQLNLTGFVYNDTKGVAIELQGEEAKIAEFIKRLNGPDAPPLADISSCVALRRMAGWRYPPAPFNLSLSSSSACFTDENSGFRSAVMSISKYLQSDIESTFRPLQSVSL